MIVPENGLYIQNDKQYEPGSEMPKPETGDIFRFGDYEYCLNKKASLLQYNPWLSNDKQNGWGVRVVDRKKSTYGSILTEINGILVVSLHNTFYECNNLIQAPEIPNTVKDLWGTFSGCVSLKYSPIIPDSVTNMRWAFEHCEMLQEMPTIPATIDDLSGTFADCISIKKVSMNDKIKTKIEDIFINCSNIFNGLN